MEITPQPKHIMNIIACRSKNLLGFDQNETNETV